MTTVNLQIHRGDTEQFDLTASRNGQPVDLTGSKVWMTARRFYTSSTPVFEKTSDLSGGIVIDPDQVTNKGKATITLATADTVSLENEQQTLVYDIQVLTADGILFTAIDGEITVKPEVTFDQS